MSTNLNSAKQRDKRHSQLDAVLFQLGSARPSDVWRGMEQVRHWLRENPEDKDVYSLLLNAVKKSGDLRDQVRNILNEMMQNGSKTAAQALSALPSTIQDLLADADDAYYAAEYERAIQLYQQVLKLDSDNSRAKDHIAKAEVKRFTRESDSGMPRVAEQYYRRARSYIAARDVTTAMDLLKGAIEAAQAKGMKYPEAEDALSNMQNLIIADELRQKAKSEIKNNNTKEAVNLYNKALKLDPTNELMKRELKGIQDLSHVERTLKKQGVLKVFTSLNRLRNTIESARSVTDIGNPLLNYVEQQLNQIRLIRTVGIIILLSIAIFPLYILGSYAQWLILPSQNTPSITYTITIFVEPTLTNTQVPLIATSSLTNTPEIATNTPIPINPTDTLTLTPTITTSGIGYINKAYASTWKEPNTGLIGNLGLNIPISLFEERVVGGTTWYRCRWVIDGIPQEGWILGSNITITMPIPPSPQP